MRENSPVLCGEEVTKGRTCKTLKPQVTDPHHTFHDAYTPGQHGQEDKSINAHLQLEMQDFTCSAKVPYFKKRKSIYVRTLQTAGPFPSKQ